MSARVFFFLRVGTTMISDDAEDIDAMRANILRRHAFSARHIIPTRSQN